MRPIGQKTEAFVRRRRASGDLQTRAAERTAAEPKRDTSVGYKRGRKKTALRGAVFQEFLVGVRGFEPPASTSRTQGIFLHLTGFERARTILWDKSGTA